MEHKRVPEMRVAYTRSCDDTYACNTKELCRQRQARGRRTRRWRAHTGQVLPDRRPSRYTQAYSATHTGIRCIHRHGHARSRNWTLQMGTGSTLVQAATSPPLRRNTGLQSDKGSRGNKGSHLHAAYEDVVAGGGEEGQGRRQVWSGSLAATVPTTDRQQNFVCTEWALEESTASRPGSFVCQSSRKRELRWGILRAANSGGLSVGGVLAACVRETAQRGSHDGDSGAGYIMSPSPPQARQAGYASHGAKCNLGGAVRNGNLCLRRCTVAYVAYLRPTPAAAGSRGAAGPPQCASLRGTAAHWLEAQHVLLPSAVRM